MTRNRFALALSLALSVAAAPVFAADQDIDKVNGSINVEAGQTYGNLETVNGSIRIDAGATVKDASTVNGSINAGDKASAHSLGTVNGSLKLGRDVSVEGGLETVNGSIFVDRGGRIGKGLETVNGAIGIVASEVGAGIETVRGDVTVGIDSHVKGGLRVQKSKGMFNIGSTRDPRIVIGPNAVVEGPLVFERPVKLYVHTSARTGPISGATAQSFSSQTAPQD